MTEYKAYWCVATKKVLGANSGYFFGGVYTDKTSNPITQTKSCPPNYNTLRFGTNLLMYICVSDDYELGYKYSMPFAGFFTCHHGNPLAISNQPLAKLMQAHPNSRSSDSVKLSSFLYQEGPGQWPKKCPSGYSQHLLTISEDDCAIHYCIKSGSLSTSGLPVIKRPPFSMRPVSNDTRLLATSSGTILSRSGGATDWTEVKAWSEVMEADKAHPVDDIDSKTSRSMPNVTTIVISVLGTAVVGLVLVIGVMGCRKHRKRRSDSLLPWDVRQRRDYGLISEENSIRTAESAE